MSSPPVVACHATDHLADRFRGGDVEALEGDGWHRLGGLDDAGVDHVSAIGGKRRATDSPIPLLAPVTSATFPASRVILRLPSRCGRVVGAESRQTG